MTHTHIIGAGLAGLSAAVELTAAGRKVTLYEAGPNAGGRCRSYFDRALGCRIDNGNHLLLSGNRAAMAYLTRIGARDTLGGPGIALFPFMDLSTGRRWTLRPSMGRIPWWIFSAATRVPGTRLREYLQILSLRRAKGTVAAALDPTSMLYRRLLEPLAIAALNTMPDVGAAHLLARVVDETLGRGGAACIPLFPREGLSESFVDPALAWLARNGAACHVSRRIVGLRSVGGRVTALETPDGPIPLGDDDTVISAVPPWVAADLIPGLTTPDAYEAIINVHFRVHAEPGEAGFLGLVGGLAEWIFVKPGIVSVTISAGNRFSENPSENIMLSVWAEVSRALDLPGPMPPARIVREKRATFAATLAQEARRPGARSALENLVLAGDWTATGLPATIEGAISSGCSAAKMLDTAA